MNSRRQVRATATLALALCLLWTGCDETTSLLDFDALRRYLDLTPAQTAVVSGHARQVIAQVEGYIRTVRQVRQDYGRSQARVDDRDIMVTPEVVEARRQAVANIQQIALLIQDELTADQLKKFERIVLPDLQRTPQELEFLMMRSGRDTFAGLGVKPSTRVSIHLAEHGLTYDQLKEKRTIVFGPGGNSSGTERFPLFVTATLLDSILLEAEVAHTAVTDSITGIEALTSLRSQYLDSKSAHEMFSIRMILSTFLHESYVSPDRWVIFVENQYGSQFEPVQIIQDFPLEAPKPSALVPRGYLGEGDLAMARKARSIEARFPYTDPFGQPILGPGTNLLRLVLFDKKNPASRTRGHWNIE